MGKMLRPSRLETSSTLCMHAIRLHALLFTAYDIYHLRRIKRLEGRTSPHLL